MKGLLLNHACLYLAVFSFVEDASCSRKPRMIGGEMAGPGEFPWMVSILHQSRKTGRWKHVCGGSIITRRHVLTVAHCRDHRPNATTIFNVGLYYNKIRYEKPEEAMYKVVKEIVHHDYKMVKEYYSYRKTVIFVAINDIGIFVSDRPIEFSANVAPISLPSLQLNLHRERVTIIGWGWIDSFGVKREHALLKADQRIVPLQNCKKFWRHLFKQICTLQGQKRGCKGDSGGPVVWRDPVSGNSTLVGLMSYVPLDCKGPYPGVNTDVYLYTDWIKQQVSSV